MIRQIICFFGKILFSLKKQIKKSDSSNPKKILVVRSGAIGDVIMTNPFLRAIRKKFPKSKISYLVGEWSKKALENNRNIDEIISFDDKIIYGKKLTGTIKLINKIRKEKFDVCFMLDKSYHWGILGFLFGIKTRIGFDRKGEGFANHLNVLFDGTKYEADYNLMLARKAGADIKNKKTEILLSKQDMDFADSFIIKNRIKGRIIGIAPGGAKNPGQEMAAKRWPAEKYEELVKRLCKNNKIILFGGPGDTEINHKIIKAASSENVFDSAGKTTIKQAAALMKKCKLFITHDSGPMHIAASTGIKVIALFGPTDPKRFAPRNATVISSKNKCCPCYDLYGSYEKCRNLDCMNSISVDIVEGVCKKAKI